MRHSVRDPSKVRRGFKHSEETKAKIRASLKLKWATDAEYRELMTNKTIASGNVDSSVRKRISETLKKRWEEPEFRATMMEKFAHRKHSSGTRDSSHRKKISAAMKKKWMDEEYRKRATEGMAKGREREAKKVRMAMPLQPKMPTTRVGVESMLSLKSVSPVKRVAAATKAVPRGISKTKSSTKRKTTKKKSAATKGQDSGVNGAAGVEAVTPITATSPSKKTTKKEPKQEANDGSISRLREERRDLYDLLYGDVDEEDTNGVGSGAAHEGSDGNMNNGRVVNGVNGGESSRGNNNNLASGNMMAGVSSNTMAALMGDDDDLDDFDLWVAIMILMARLYLWRTIHQHTSIDASTKLQPSSGIV